MHMTFVFESWGNKVLLNLTLNNSLWFKLDDNKSIIDGHLQPLGIFLVIGKNFVASLQMKSLICDLIILIYQVLELFSYNKI